MELEILCEVPFTDDEERQIADAAERLGLTRGEVVRAAVKNFSAVCVPTHSEATKTDAA
ncbi:MAG: hypothetical protein IJG84_21240 [Kiritimatiellae bacterium]|nr:hypothetical protein [Kiritimatiellia bacterium]